MHHHPLAGSYPPALVLAWPGPVMMHNGARRKPCSVTIVNLSDFSSKLQNMSDWKPQQITGLSIHPSSHPSRYPSNRQYAPLSVHASQGNTIPTYNDQRQANEPASSSRPTTKQPTDDFQIETSTGIPTSTTSLDISSCTGISAPTPAMPLFRLALRERQGLIIIIATD